MTTPQAQALADAAKRQKVARVLLALLWRKYDAAGISMARSHEAVLLETAMSLFGDPDASEVAAADALPLGEYVDSARSLVSAMRATALGFATQAEAPAAPALTVPDGYALVPLRMNPEMERLAAEGEWQWADMLAAAGAITEEQYKISIASTPLNGWTGNADADLALILLDRLDVSDDLVRVEQIEGLVRRLAATPPQPAEVAALREECKRLAVFAVVAAHEDTGAEPSVSASMRAQDALQQAIDRLAALKQLELDVSDSERGEPV